MFGTRTDSSGAAGSETAGGHAPWVRTLINLCVVILILAVIIEVYRWAERRASPLVKARVERIAVRAELENVPAWLDRRILQQILDVTNKLGIRDQATLDRFQDPLDKDILREIAANYTNSDANGVNHWAIGANAWIKRIVEVRRVINPDRTAQTIQIFAEYRKPAAWVERGGKYYLIDLEQVRLPEEYTADDRKGTAGLMVLTGIEAKAPLPSETWEGEDLVAGLKLADFLGKRTFASQIASIDMNNFRGRHDHATPAVKPWIVLNTIFSAPEADSAGMALVPPPSTQHRVVYWGRPIGEESFYEVHAAAKLKALNEIYMRFNRIDADRDYVDIRFDQVLLPKLAAQGEMPAGAVLPRG